MFICCPVPLHTKPFLICYHVNMPIECFVSQISKLITNVLIGCIWAGISFSTNQIACTRNDFFRTVRSFLSGYNLVDTCASVSTNRITWFWVDHIRRFYYQKVSLQWECCFGYQLTYTIGNTTRKISVHR